ncbi:hypothetical protein CYL31_01865 [Marinomonas sp. A3A]|jgi:hypothetical protein|uniref:hypothetical protein n=1 Tax=Marinomonas sp. A3A TaxID=2065312 RepID=UPI001BB3D7B7|nr:hypothetical protein [Marinomonas sp. A3A]QUX90220.1 hypothetical protein CYL31_01865 [Marinomonas sp. A3A]
MTLSVLEYLKKNGPCLSSEVTEYLVSSGISSDAARQRVSRGSKQVLRLDLSLPKRVKFLYTKEQSGTWAYWVNLQEALLSTNSAYGFAITALRARGGIMPKNFFEIASGSPIKQKKHLSASTVLSRLISTNLVKETTVEGVGPCIYLGLHTNHVDELIAPMRARYNVESITLEGIKQWLQNLGFVSYNLAITRSNQSNPTVSTTAWDLMGQSYLSPVVSFVSNTDKPKNGFVVCEILLTEEVSEVDILPFIQKLNALRSLNNVGKQLVFFVADSFSLNALKKLKSIGVSPATTKAIFDTETAKGLRNLTEILSNVIEKAITPEKIDEIFKSLGKIEGAANRLRGNLFEYVIAETMRAEFTHIELNRVCQGLSGSKEADVICISQSQVLFIEGKGYNINRLVDIETVDYWLTQQIPVFRQAALNHSDWKTRKMRFEFWSTGTFSDEARTRLEEAEKQASRYEIGFKDMHLIKSKIQATSNSALKKTFEEHFAKHPMNNK